MGWISDLLGISAEKTSSNQNFRGLRVDEVTDSSSEQLEIDEEGVNKIMQDLLGGTQGLASIFSAEQASGIFNSSVASTQASEFAANVVGEIAKLQAKRVTTGTSMTTSDTKGEEGNSGTTFGI